jgi:hypothetical protein
MFVKVELREIKFALSKGLNLVYITNHKKNGYPRAKSG